MDVTHLFELAVGMVMVIIALHWAANRFKLPPSVALLVGGCLLAFLPGLPTFSVNPDLVLVLFLPPLLFDAAWTIPIERLKRHVVGVASLAVGAVVFTTVAVAIAAHLVFPQLPIAACAALGAIVAPPDAISARATLSRVTLPRRIRMLLEGESLLNDATGLVLFRFAVAAAATGTFHAGQAFAMFLLLAVGGAAVGVAAGVLWVKFARRLGDDYLIIAATGLLSWAAYLLAETVHVSGVIAAVTAGLIAAWNQHTVLSASTRMQGAAFWDVVVFLLEAAVFVLIGLSLRGVVERAGGFGVVFETMTLPVLIVLATLVAARFLWIFGSETLVAAWNRLGWTRLPALGFRASTVLSWAGARGVVTLALALSVPETFPGRDVILVTAFAIIVGSVLVQGTTFGGIIGWARLVAPESEKPPMTMTQAEAAMAQAQVKTVEKLACSADGELIHPMLLKRYRTRAEMSADYVQREEDYKPRLIAHFDVILAAVKTGREELLRLHRAGEIDDEILNELERDLDLEELSAISAKS